MNKVEFFRLYCGIGLKIIPLLPKSKQPINKRWNSNWSVASARRFFEENEELNMGFLLGEVVDVEGDTPEANEKLFSLIGNTPHPIYQSSKSIHHLFLNPDPNLTILKVDGIEFRANKHQSVLPPSRHSDGTTYAWLKGTSFPIPAMPEGLLNYYNSKKSRLIRPKIKPGHLKTWCTKCSKPCFRHEKRFRLEKIAFEDLGYGWQCLRCRKVDVRQACRKIRKNLNLTEKLR